MRKWILIFSPLFFFVILFVVLRTVIQPRVETWVLAQVRQLIEEKSPVLLQADRFAVQWLPPQVHFENIQITPKPKERLGFTEAKVEHLTIRIDALQALAGRVHLALIRLTKPVVEVDWKQLPNDSSAEFKWAPLFRQIRSLPLESLALEDAEVHLKGLPDETEVAFGSLDLLTGWRRDRLWAEVKTPQLMFTRKGRTLRVGARFGLSANATNLEVDEIHLMAEGQTVLLQGKINSIDNLLAKPDYEYRLKVESTFESLGRLLAPLGVEVPLKGQLSLDSSGRGQGLALPAGSHRLAIKSTSIGAAEIGALELEATSTAESLKASRLRLTHSAGTVVGDGLTMSADFQAEPTQLSAQAPLKSEGVDLFQLLKAIDVGEIPVDLKIGASLDCQAKILPDFLVQCEGSASGQDLVVKTDLKDTEPLVALKAFSAKGGFSVDLEKVTYQSSLSLGEDRGQSSGVIRYDQGFKITYETPDVALSHIGQISGLKLEGRTSIKGSTEGNSNSATFSMAVKGREIFFENFFLGEPQGTITYKKGTLFFEDLSAKIGESSVAGRLETDLLNPQLRAQIKSQEVSWPDLFAVFQRIFVPPVEFSGKLAFETEVEGPFQLGALSYNLNATIPRLVVAGESFHSGVVRLQSRSGEMLTEVFQIMKGSRLVSLQGQSHPDGRIEAVVSAEQLLMEESEFIKSIDSSMSGRVQTVVDIGGTFLDPDLNFQLQLEQLIIDNQEFPVSTAEFTVNRRELLGKLSLFSGHLTSEYQIPWSPEGPFYLNLNAIDWNFTTMAAFIGAGALLSDYEASVTGSLRLAAPQGGFWNASGEGNISKFLLQRGSLSLKNSGPMELRMDRGVASLKNFKATGEDMAYEVTGEKIAKNNLRFNVAGYGSIRLFHVFVPFLEELGGMGVLNIAFSGTSDQVEILGQATLKDGFAKLKGFPHAVERLSSQIQFSQTRVLINQIQGSFAGGLLNGDGTVLLKGVRNFETNIRGRIEGVSLNVPDKIRTQGNLDLQFTGSWFPFLLSGDYTVTGGVFEKELEEEATIEQIKQSSFLPKQIRETTFEPVELDLRVDLARPFPVRNSLVQGLATGQLRVRGAPERPRLQGTVTSSPGTKITFRDNTFEVSTGNLKFNNEPELNPEIYVAARSRVSEYDINLLVQGTAKNPVVQMTSLPPLPEAELISLLALGFISDRNRQVGPNNEEAVLSQAQAQGINMGVNLFLSNTGLRKQAPVDFSVTSAYDDTKNESVHKYTIKYRVSDKAEASATRTTNNDIEARLKYSLSPTLSTIGSWEKKSNSDTTVRETDANEAGIFGIDLDFSQEFR